MAQQTQIARVAERFGPFMERFPTPAAMAEADEREVLALWSGLGYYRRARSLHAAARAIVGRHNGVTPTDPAALAELPGVGRYTAGAVASIAGHVRTPIVDGNIARVLVRLEGQDLAHGAADTARWAWSRAESLADAAGADRIAAFNEGLMELGATVCTPGEPDCATCPVRTECVARREGRQREIPRPKARAKRSILHAGAAVVTDGRGRVLLERRPSAGPSGGLWGGLWQAPTVDSEKPVTVAGMRKHLLDDGDHTIELTRAGETEFRTTHRDVRFRVWRAEARSPLTAELSAVGERRWAGPGAFGSLALGSAQRRVLAAGGVSADEA
ncbi:MAG: NUDIX domain-containing protein [Planctomycetota bacterium]